MKKIICTLLIMCFSVCCFAQINRTIWGMTLGTSTKQQVKAILIQKGYTVYTESDGSYCVTLENVNFGGGLWTYANFIFVDNKLSEVFFQNNEEKSPVRLNDLYDKLKNSLDKKYSSYYFHTDLSQNEISNTSYYDGKTAVFLTIMYSRNVKYINIDYVDDDLQAKKAQYDIDEL